MDWIIKESGYKADQFADRGNRFLIGNGYMGIRGTLDEDRKDRLVAVNLAGIYDQVGDGWREPLNAPNPFYTVVKVAGRKLILDADTLDHHQSLDFQKGIFRRVTTWQVGPDHEVTVTSSRFASMDNAHLLGVTYEVSSNQAINLTLNVGIDGQVWDIHGPHYDRVSYEDHGTSLYALAQVQGSEKAVFVGRKTWCSMAIDPVAETLEEGLGYMSYDLSLEADQSVVFRSLAMVYTTEDTDQPSDMGKDQLEALTEDAYEEAYEASIAAWARIWETSFIDIEGDLEAMVAMNYSIYHLNCAAPRHQSGLSIPARALSGQTYKGAIFWDSEIFMLDYFLYTQPEVAKSLVQYRIDTLGGALEKAKAYGLEGAFYPWESQEGGYDACSDYNVTDVFTGRPVRTYFKDKQVHISSAIVWAIRHYVAYTGDVDILLGGGARAIIECAKFYRSLLVKPVTGEAYELHDVIGPDEYHERVNNNAYTNRMALYTIESALDLLADQSVYGALAGDYDLPSLMIQLETVKNRLYIPKANEAGLIEQFDGYFKLEDISPAVAKSRLKDPREYWGGGNGVASDTQVIKQADVVTMLEMFHEDYDRSVLAANWDYYEPRTEHGSSLSACMYAMVACRMDQADRAYPFFMKSATAEIRGGGKQWAGLVYIGGTHPAAAGGAWKNVVQGFAGLKVIEGQLVAHPNLPSHWKRLSFPIQYGGRLYDLKIQGKQWQLIERGIL